MVSDDSRFTKASRDRRDHERAPSRELPDSGALAEQSWADRLGSGDAAGVPDRNCNRGDSGPAVPPGFLPPGSQQAPGMGSSLPRVRSTAPEAGPVLPGVWKPRVDGGFGDGAAGR